VKRRELIENLLRNHASNAAGDKLGVGMNLLGVAVSLEVGDSALRSLVRAKLQKSEQNYK
jgi:hypothetical protein